MKIPLRLFSVIGILLFVLILTRIDIPSLLAIFASVNLSLLVLAVAVNGVAIIVKSFKWKVIVNTVNSRFTIMDSIRAFLIGFSFSVLTPAKVGDLVRACYVRNETCSTGRAISTVVTDRLLDMIMLVVIAGIGIFLFSYLYHLRILSMFILAIIIIGVACGIGVIANKLILSRILRPFFTLFVPASMKERVTLYFHEFYEGLFAFYRHRSAFLLALALAIVSWIPPFVYGFLLARSLGIPIGFSYFIIVIPVISLLDLLPISISGIGTRDAALIYLFGLQGIQAETSVAFSLLYLFMSYWLVAIIGALFWIRHPVRIDTG